jgi:AcrR family transcriptional regulator
MSSSSEPASLDGRTARRARNSDAVLDAVHELFVEGQQVPNIEDVAARAGVSLRSVYRYFPDSRQLMLAALVRRTQIAEPVWELRDEGRGSFEERVDHFVEHRMALYDHSAPTIRAALALADRVPEIAEQADLRRRQVAEQARRHFARELVGLSNEEAESMLTCVELLCQFESLDLLRSRLGLPRRRAHDVLVTGVRALLKPS